MDSLRIVLVIVGVLVILALLGHGLWTVRRNNQDSKGREQSIERKRRRQADDLFSASEELQVADDEPELSPLEPDLLAQEGAPARRSSAARDKRPGNAEAGLQQIEIDLDAEPSFELEPTMSEQLDDDMVQSGTSNEPLLKAENKPEEPDAAANEHSSAQRDDSVQAAEQKDRPSAEEQSETAEPLDSQQNIEAAPSNNEPEVITLFITGDIQGAILLQMTAELGLKFGDMNIFHRHTESSGHGPVLFSVANMFNPGTFDIHNMERFHTEGLVLFMTLPMKSDGHQAFTMMYNAANKIADAMPRAAVLDSNRNPVTKQSVQHTYQRIREFERQQRLQNSTSRKPNSPW